MLRFLNGRLLGTCIEGAPPPEGGTPPAGDQWFAGADAETTGYLQNRGMDKMDAKAAAFAAIKAHREAEKNLGVPADQILRMPKDANDAAGWDSVYSKLGVPKEAKGYDLSVIKHADGSDLSDAEKTAFANRALALKLTPAKALEFVQETVKEADTSGSAGKTEYEGKLAAEKTDLAKNWGPNYEANMFVAKQAAAALGVTPEAVAALEKVLGYSKVMEMFRNVGTKIGEDRFVLNPQNRTQAMTREQATERKSALMNDKVWVKSYLDGDAQKIQEMTALNTMIVSQR